MRSRAMGESPPMSLDDARLAKLLFNGSMFSSSNNDIAEEEEEDDDDDGSTGLEFVISVCCASSKSKSRDDDKSSGRCRGSRIDFKRCVVVSQSRMVVVVVPWDGG